MSVIEVGSSSLYPVSRLKAEVGYALGDLAYVIACPARRFGQHLSLIFRCSNLESYH